MTNPVFDPGILRQSLELQSFTDISDGRGGFSRTWSTIATLFAAVKPASASRQIIAGTPQLIITHQIIIRYRDGISFDQRFVWDDRIFNVHIVQDLDETKRFHSCQCEEVEQ